MRIALTFTIALAALALPLSSQADQGRQQVGDYTIYYNALAANALPSASMKTYGLQHSDRQGLIVISVSRGADAASVQVPAKVSGHASTLLGKAVPLKFRRIDDHGNLSTLGSFTVPGTGTVSFDLEVKPQGGPAAHLQFTHDYVVD